MKNSNKLNILFLTIFSILIFNNAYSQDSSVTKKQLNAMNRVKMPAFVDTCSNNSGEPFKILIIGNSITRHGISEKIGWNHISGMAASNINNDYAHILFKKTEVLIPNRRICMRISTLSTFERNFHNFNLKTIDSLVNYKPDVIIFQLGENVVFDSINTKLLFEKKYIELINYAKGKFNPIVICTTPFFPSQEKNEVIKKVTYKTKSFLTDLSHLYLLDKTNYVKNELNYPGDKSTWIHLGIGVHPGDFGMENIATQIFLNINAVINYNSK